VRKEAAASPKETPRNHIGDAAPQVMPEELAAREMRGPARAILIACAVLVPLLAMSFSVLKGLGAAQELRRRLATFLEPLGTQGAEITEQVMAAVENVNYGVLGSVGLAFFLYTAIAMVQKVEESFNYVWYVTQSRSFARRFTEYTLVLVFGPLLMIMSLGLLTSLQNEDLVQYLIANDIVGPLFVFVSKLTPYLIITGVFTFLYTFIPNTKVRFRAALLGGVTGGFLWVTASLVFTAFVVGAVFAGDGENLAIHQCRRRLGHLPFGVGRVTVLRRDRPQAILFGNFELAQRGRVFVEVDDLEPLGGRRVGEVARQVFADERRHVQLGRRGARGPGGGERHERHGDEGQRFA